MANGLLGGLDAYWKCDTVPRVVLSTNSLGTKDYSRHDRHVVNLSGIAFSTSTGGVDGGLFVNQGTDIANRRGIGSPLSRVFKYGAQSFSCNMWLNRTTLEWSGGSSDPWMGVWDDVAAADERAWMALWSAGAPGRHTFTISSDGTAGTISTVQTAVGTPSGDVWHLLSFGYDHELGHIWIQFDAGTRTTTAHTTGAYAGSTADFTQMWARFNTQRVSEGGMDEVSIHGRVTDATDVSAIYASGAGLLLDDWDTAAAPPVGTFPFTDVNVQYDSHLEEDGSLDLRDQVASPGALNLTAIGAPPLPSTLGFMGYGRRGLGNTPRLERTSAIGDHFDISGSTSFSAIMWARMDTALDDSPQVFGIWDSTPAGEQFLTVTLEASGGNPIVPIFRMYDGSVLDNNVELVAHPSVPWRIERWQMIGIAYDAATDQMRLFWGREQYEQYYVTTTGFSAFGSASASTPIAFGKFGGPNNRLGVDHFSWWKGRAFTEGDFWEHWRDYHGLAFSNFDASPVPPPLGEAYDYTDKDATWLCEEPLAADDLEAVEGPSLDMAVVGTNAGSVAGKFGLGRGFTKAIGEGNASYWRQDQVSGNALFDLRGLTSFSVCAWLKLISGTDGDPTFFDVHSVQVAGQATQSWFGHSGWGLIPNGLTPVFLVEDGLIAFKSLFVSAVHDPTPGIERGVYQFMGISYDAAVNKMRCFWGERDGPGGGNYHFSEARGFVGGFKYARQTGSGAPNFQGVGFGRFTGGGLPAQMDIDHTFYWKGRALKLRDFLNLWNDHVGLDTDELVSLGPGGGGGGVEDEQFIVHRLLTRRR